MVSENRDSEKMDSENRDSEKMDSEKMDSKKMGSDDRDPSYCSYGIGFINVQTKLRRICSRKNTWHNGMGGQRTVIIFRQSEQLDGRNWFVMVAPSIVLAISKFVYRQSNEEQDVQNVVTGEKQQFRGPLIQTPLKLRLMNQTRNIRIGAR